MLKWFSAYMLDPSHGWIGTHRLPLGTAVKVAKAMRSHHPHCLVALTPDAVDPTPYLALVEELEPEFAVFALA